MKFRIKEVFDKASHKTILELLKVTLPGEALPDLKIGYWWLVYDEEGTAVAFAGMVPSSQLVHAGYLIRCGVLEEARGNNLQIRLIRARERKAKKLGYTSLVTDTVSWAIASSNNLLKCGYKTFWPSYPWALKDSVYWKKDFNG
jgi:GNAT superfamily N-acetyltransferase